MFSKLGHPCLKIDVLIFVFSPFVIFHSFLKSGTKKYLFSHARCRNSLLPHCAKVWKDNCTFSHFMQELIVKKINSLNPYFLKIKKSI